MKEDVENLSIEENKPSELPDKWWRKVYLAVVIFTIFIISSLALFSWYFSN